MTLRDRVGLQFGPLLCADMQLSGFNDQNYRITLMRYPRHIDTHSKTVNAMVVSQNIQLTGCT